MKEQIKLISWNVNSIRKRLNILESIIEKEDPDIILLQETRVDSCQEIKGYFLYENPGQKGRKGVAIFSKEQLTEIFSDQEGRLIKGKYNNLNIFSIYAPSGMSLGSSIDHKIKFFQDLKKNIDSLIDENEDLVLGGDFNITINKNEINIEDPYTEIEKNTFRSLLVNLHDPTPKGELYLTWWDYRNNCYVKNLGLGLDKFLFSKNVQLEKKIKILREIRGLEQTSDHAPVLINIHF